MAAWSIFEKRNVETLSRVASARTLDGFKVRARIALNFPRAMVTAEAEEVMMQYAKAYATAIERELSGGEVPFEENELLDIITKAVTVLPRQRVRVVGLHVWRSGTASSRSMPAVGARGNDKPTVPAMRAVKAPADAASSASEPSIHTAVTPPPAAPDAKPSPGKYTLRPDTSGLHPQVSRAQQASIRRAMASSRPSRATPTGPKASRPLPRAVIEHPSPRQTPNTSGVVPAVAESTHKSAFSRAVREAPSMDAEVLGKALGQAVRDGAAALLFASLEAAHSALVDPLAVLEAGEKSGLRRELVVEGCVCVAFLMYEALGKATVAQSQAIRMVEVSCTVALGGGDAPVAQIGRYMASSEATREFSRRCEELLHIAETRQFMQKLDRTLRELRAQLKECVRLISERSGDARTRSA